MSENYTKRSVLQDGVAFLSISLTGVASGTTKDERSLSTVVEVTGTGQVSQDSIFYYHYPDSPRVLSEPGKQYVFVKVDTNKELPLEKIPRLEEFSLEINGNAVEAKRRLDGIPLPNITWANGDRQPYEAVQKMGAESKSETRKKRGGGGYLLFKID